MKLIFINGSPKAKDSASECMLGDLKAYLKHAENQIFDLHIQKPQLEEAELKLAASCDGMVFAFPLYVDGIPSHLLECLTQLEHYFKEHNYPEKAVYAIVNCGFYEGEQNELALDVMENWSQKARCIWGQGIGVGAGGMTIALKKVKPGKGPKKAVGQAMKQMASHIENREAAPNLFVTFRFPRWLYKRMAEMGWKQAVKDNGLKKEDLDMRR